MIAHTQRYAKLLNAILLFAFLIIALPIAALKEVNNLNIYAIFAITISSYATLSLLKRKAWISFSFLAINTLFALMVFAKLFATDYSPDSWRAALFDYRASELAFTLTLNFLLVSSLTLLIFSRSKCTLNLSKHKTEKPRIIFLISAATLLTAFLLTDFKFLSYGKFAYGGLSSGIPFLELITILSYIAIIDFKNISSTKLGVAYLAILAFCVASIFLFGFRGIILGCFIVMLSKISETKKINLLHIITFGILAFLSFIIIGIIRAENEVNLESLISMTGKHEENEFYTILLSVQNPNVLSSNSYIDSLLRIFGRASETISSKFASETLPLEITSVGANMGMHFISEAFLNFGYYGALFFTFAVCLLISLIEKLSNISLLARCMSIMLLAQSYTLAYYGSSNFLSMVIQGVVILYAYAFYTKLSTITAVSPHQEPMDN